MSVLRGVDLACLGVQQEGLVRAEGSEVGCLGAEEWSSTLSREAAWPGYFGGG